MIRLHNAAPVINNTGLYAGVNLTLDRSQVVVIMGKSGIGKSSLFRCIADPDLPRLGDIQVISDFFQVFQDQNQLFPWMTISDNLELAGCQGIARSLVEEWQLQHCWQKKPNQLSVGERQRFTLIRALCRPEHLLLCDEPLSAVDSMTALGLARDFKQKAHSMAKSVLWITHNIMEARSVGDRILVLESHGDHRNISSEVDADELLAQIH